MTMTRYSLATQTSGQIALGVTVVMAGVGAWMMWAGVGADQPMWYRVPFWAVWFSILLFAAYRQATTAHEIVVHENDEIEFVGILNRVRVPAHSIRSIRATGGRYGGLIIGHHAGTVHLAGAFNGFHQFVTELKSVNPGVELVGC